MIKSVEDFDLGGKTVFVRVDFNVPLSGAEISDDSRIQAALPTINHCLERGARLVLASHLGRPKGERKPELSLAPVARRLSDLLGHEVEMAADCIGDEVQAAIRTLKDGDVLLLENVRFHKAETRNEDAFCRALARGVDVFINDAFGSLHRAHASVAGIAAFVPEKGMGFLVRKEYDHLGHLLESPEKPFIAILGGAKVSDKINVIENLMERVDGFVIGGAMAFTFLKAQGSRVGSSLVEEDKLSLAASLLERTSDRGVSIYLPIDHVVAPSPDQLDKKEVTRDGNVPDDMMGLDIGPQTVKFFANRVGEARTLLWNGPMGMFERPGLDEGTREMARILAEHPGFTAVGGGDSAAALKKFGYKDKVTHVSTGGGASLEFLAGKVLPGFAALEQ